MKSWNTIVVRDKWSLFLASVTEPLSKSCFRFQSFKPVSKYISEYIWGNHFVLEELVAAFSHIPLQVQNSIANARALRKVQDFSVS